MYVIYDMFRLQNFFFKLTKCWVSVPCLACWFLTQLVIWWNGTPEKILQLLSFFIYSFLCHDLCLPTSCRCRGILLHLITLTDTHTHARSLGGTPLDEGSAHHIGLYLIRRNGHKIQTSMPPRPSEIRTHNPSKRAVGNIRLRPRNHRDRLASLEIFLLNEINM